MLTEITVENRDKISRQLLSGDIVNVLLEEVWGTNGACRSAPDSARKTDQIKIFRFQNKVI